MSKYKEARVAMVDCQVRPSDVTRYPVIEAMLNIPREEFVPSDMKAIAYAGQHIALPSGRVVMEPRTLGKMLDAAAVRNEDLVLVVGAGLGYEAAVLGRMAEAVIALEADENLAAEATRILSEQDAVNVVVETGDLAAGVAAHGPYDLIFVNGGVETVPDGLTGQLKAGGQIVAIVAQNGASQCQVGTATDRGVTWRRAFDATAPLLPGFEREKVFEF